MTNPATPNKPIKPVNPLNKTNFIAKQAIIMSVIAIIAAVTAIIFGVLNYQSLISRGHDMQNAIQSNMKSQAMMNTLTRDWQKQATELNQIQANLKKLKNSQNVPLQKTLAETSYLIHLANLHLVVGHDKATALRILTVVQNRLSPIMSTAFLPLKQAVITDIAALKKEPLVSVNSLYKQIDQIASQVSHLNPLPGHIPSTLKDAIRPIKPTVPNTMHWYDRLWDSVKQIKHVFIIHQIQNPTTPVTEPDKIFYIKENMRMKLATAQWALLNQNSAIYQQSLKDVHGWLAEFFAMRKETQPLLTHLDKLIKTPITSKLPSLANTMTALNHIDLTPAQKSVAPNQPKMPAALPTSTEPKNHQNKKSVPAPIKQITAPATEKSVEI